MTIGLCQKSNIGDYFSNPRFNFLVGEYLLLIALSDSYRILWLFFPDPAVVKISDIYCCNNLCLNSILPEFALLPTVGEMCASQQIPLRRRSDRRSVAPDASIPIPVVQSRRDPWLNRNDFKLRSKAEKEWWFVNTAYVYTCTITIGHRLMFLSSYNLRDVTLPLSTRPIT